MIRRDESDLAADKKRTKKAKWREELLISFAISQQQEGEGEGEEEEVGKYWLSARFSFSWGKAGRGDIPRGEERRMEQEIVVVISCLDHGSATL